jgi:chromosome transmission fidelity protein 1
MINLSRIVPAGMVVFFPSYAFLSVVRAQWKTSGVMDKLSAKKKLLFEPQESGKVEEVLKDFATAAVVPSGGALLMAVVGAKLSEGLNFSDDLARAVVLVGLPFPNLGSTELKERMRYVTDLEKQGGLPKRVGGKEAGAELYENLAMKAVNQSIGKSQPFLGLQ